MAKSNETILAGLVRGVASAKKELAALGSDGIRLQELAKLVLKQKEYAPALAEVASVAIPQLAGWVRWNELAALAPLIESFGADETLQG
jgi:hypothetical protein